MAERKALSKRIRFEVFKRDKFTCQYCGQKSPDIVLQVDHIDPIAKGGGNELLNLITSCFDCNNGKRDTLLDDNSIIEKQRKQLEILQERREQIELMLEWKKSLSTFDNDILDMIVDYVNSKIKPLSLNDNGSQSVSEWLKKFTVEKILDGIDEAAKKYIKYEDGNADKESVELFMSKIAGVIVVKGMPPIQKKLAYIKGIARNRFAYWDDKKGATILNTYLTACKNYGWKDTQILNDLETEVEPLTKKSKNWSEWKNTIEKWADDINNWNKEEEEEKEVEQENITNNYEQKVTIEQLETAVRYETGNVLDRIEALILIGQFFDNFNSAAFKKDILQQMEIFISGLIKKYNEAEKPEIDEEEDYVFLFVEYCGLKKYFDASIESEKFGIQWVLSDKCEGILKDLFTEFYLPAIDYKRKEIDILLKLYSQFVESQIKKEQ